MRKMDLAGVIIFIMVTTGMAFSQDVYIPVFDPVNDDIALLIDKGYLEDLTVSEKPWTISEVANSIILDRSAFDTESSELAGSILDRLRPPQEVISRRLFADFNLGMELKLPF